MCTLLLCKTSIGILKHIITVSLKSCFFLCAFLSIHTLAFSQQTIKDKQAFSIGESFQMHSEVLGEDRTLNVYLPQGYAAAEKSYPVIYLLDGSADEDFIHIAGLVQFASFPWINIISESIVIGIANVDRRRDFTYPTEIKELKEKYPTTGASQAFIRFIADELQPLVDANYRTTKEKTIVGQSLGGLLATEILYKQAQLFDNYIIISPSLWWDDESLLALEPDALAYTKKIYVGVGKEGEIMERDALQLYEKLKLEHQKQENLFFGFFEKQDHGDVLHLAVYDAFEKLFKTKKETTD